MASFMFSNLSFSINLTNPLLISLIKLLEMLFIGNPEIPPGYLFTMDLSVFKLPLFLLKLEIIKPQMLYFLLNLIILDNCSLSISGEIFNNVGLAVLILFISLSNFSNAIVSWQKVVPSFELGQEIFNVV